MENDLERTLDAEDILGLFDPCCTTAPASENSITTRDTAAAAAGESEETVNPADFSALLGAMSSPVPTTAAATATAAAVPKPAAAARISTTPSPRLDPSFFNKNSPRRARDTLNPNELSFLNELTVGPRDSIGSSSNTAMSSFIRGAAEDVTLDANDELFAKRPSTVCTPENTASVVSFTAATATAASAMATNAIATTMTSAAAVMVVPKSILKGGRGAQVKKVHSVQFVRTKSVLRFDNQFPVAKLKQEDETAVETPGKHLQMKEIREERLNDSSSPGSSDEEGAGGGNRLNKRLNFKEEEEDEFERELFRNSQLQTEEEEKTRSPMGSALMLHTRRHSDVMDEEEDHTLDIPSLAQFHRDSLASIPEHSTSSAFQSQLPFSPTGNEEEKGPDNRRLTLEVPSFMDFRVSLPGAISPSTAESAAAALSSIQEEEREDDTAGSLCSDARQPRRQQRDTLDVPSLMDFRGRDSIALAAPEATSSPNSFVSIVQQGHDDHDQDHNRRQTLDVPSLMDFGALPQSETKDDDGLAERRQTLDVPSLLDFGRMEDETVYEETRGSGMDKQQRRETLDVPNFLDFKRDSVAAAAGADDGAGAREEDDSILQEAAANPPPPRRLSMAPPELQNKVVDFLNEPSAGTAANAAQQEQQACCDLDALLRHFYPNFQPLQAPRPPPNPPVAAATAVSSNDLGNFVHDVQLSAEDLCQALVNVHYTDNCLDFVGNQLYQVATQRRGLLEASLPNTAAAANLLTAKQKKQVKHARLEAENEISQWMIQVQTEFIRSLQNQRARVEDDITRVLLPEQLRMDQAVKQARQDLESREQSAASAQHLAEMRCALERAAREEAMAVEAMEQTKRELERENLGLEALRHECAQQARDDLPIAALERAADVVKLQLTLQQAFSAWELVRATASSAEVEFAVANAQHDFAKFTLDIRVEESNIRVQMGAGEPDEYVRNLVSARSGTAISLFDLVHLLSLIEEHVAL